MFGGSGFSVVTFASAPGFIYTASARSDASALSLSSASFSVNSSVLENASPQLELVTAGSTFISSLFEQSSALDLDFSSFSVNSSIIELGSMTDVLDADVNFVVSVIENTQVTQTASAFVDFVVSVLNIGEVADELTASFTVFSNLLETVSPEDVLITAGSILNPVVLEDASGESTFDPKFVFLSFTSSTAFCYEQCLADVNFAVKVEESPSASDNIRANRTTIAVIQESVEAGDAFIARYLWEPINTFEQQAWNTIKTADVELLITVGGGFSAGAFSSGPISGLGGVTSITPITEIWATEETSQADTWNLVRTVD